MRLQPLLCIAALGASALCACGSATSGVPAARPSAAGVPASPQNQSTPIPGTEWTYDYTISVPSPWPLPTSGTLGIRYDGTKPYRGANYGETEAVGSITAQDIYVYFSWSGAFEEYATANMLVPPMPCDTPPRSETVLNMPLDFIHAHPLMSGTAEAYLCGTPDAALNWSLVVNDEGPATVTVPAGTFASRKVAGVWVLGQVERHYTAYVYGDDVVERDTTQYQNGTANGTFVVKLHAGPTNVAIPGPSELGADYW